MDTPSQSAQPKDAAPAEQGAALAEHEAAHAAQSIAAADDDAPLAPGSIVAERYRVVSLIGEGGMGAVYRVEHVHMRKAFALKVLRGEMLTSPEAVARFEREAVAAAAIDHPNVVTATDFGKLDDGACFLVLELIDGSNLRGLLEAGRLDASRAKRIVRGIAAAMAAAHDKGIIHRDLKPENVMLVQRGGEDDGVKVLDFGIAKIAAPDAPTHAAAAAKEAQPLTLVGAVMGTPDYMAPEQALGQPVDARTDLYALGVIFYELVTGSRPFRGGTMTVLRQHMLEPPPPMPPEVIAATDPRLVDIILTLLAKDPAQRFESAKALVAALDALDLKVAHAPTMLASSASLSSEAQTPARVGAVTFAVTTWPTIAKGVWSRHPRAAIGAAVGLVAVMSFAFRGGSSERAADARARAPMPTASGRAIDREPDANDKTKRVDAPRPVESARVVAPKPEEQTIAPLPPAPSTSASARPAAQSRGRRTGPGGIYIPPPRTWFK